jgi:DNA repair photolyase
VHVGVGISLAILDDDLHRSLEPGTPSPRARLDLVRAVRAAGLDCGVMVAPVLPWLTDSAEALEPLLAALADAGATGVTVLPLHLRPGAREWYLGWLDQHRPDLVARYRRLYGRGSYVGGEYRRGLRERVQPLLRHYGFAGAGTREGAEPTDDASRDRAGGDESADLPAPTLF